MKRFWTWGFLLKLLVLAFALSILLPMICYALFFLSLAIGSITP